MVILSTNSSKRPDAIVIGIRAICAVVFMVLSLVEQFVYDNSTKSYMYFGISLVFIFGPHVFEFASHFIK